ncbi:IS110 family transposase, partial [Cupriavidus sp. WGtm5]|nr:IS110 family transposase [Cupriavidus sp. WGlv3]MCO4893705.1 IS110 family transposase [Cupriavidus sp. WGtm5]
MELTVIGMDIAKHVFQLHAVNVSTGEVERIKLKRSQVTNFFTRRERSLIAIEAYRQRNRYARTE